MHEDEKLPRTTRDALIIELLGDLGLIHDQIKNLPTDIDQAISGSISLVADAVENAEKTALDLAKSIETHKNSTIKDIDEAVKCSLEQHVVNTFSELDDKVRSLQHKINTFELVDPKGRRLSFLLATTSIFLLCFSATVIYGIYAGASSKMEELNLIISTQDAKEKKGLSVLTQQAREQYQSATTK
jgi:hypothetical protein